MPRATAGHSELVSRFAVALGERAGLQDAQLRCLRLGCVLHDVGKIGVPDAILRKPCGLTDGEVAAVRQHPQMGAVMVSSVPGLEATAGSEAFGKAIRPIVADLI